MSSVMESQNDIGLLTTGLVYDDVDMARIFNSNQRPDLCTPDPIPGEMCIYHGGWTPPQLRKAFPRSLTSRKDFDELFAAVEPGYYRLLFPTDTEPCLPGERIWRLRSQNRKGFNWAPLSLVLVGLLVHEQLAKEYLLQEGSWVCPDVFRHTGPGFNNDIAVISRMEACGSFIDVTPSPEHFVNRSPIVVYKKC